MSAETGDSGPLRRGELTGRQPGQGSQRLRNRSEGAQVGAEPDDDNDTTLAKGCHRLSQVLCGLGNADSVGHVVAADNDHGDLR